MGVQDGPEYAVRFELSTDLVESGAVSTMLNESSRWTGHASASLLTASATYPPLATVLAEPGAILGVASFALGTAGAGWDYYFHSNTEAMAGAAIGITGEYMQRNVVNMVPGPVKPYGYVGMEIYQTGFREVFYQMGSQPK